MPGADLVVFGNAAAARDGLTAMPVNTGEDFYNTIAVNQLEIPQDMVLRAAGLFTSTIANLLQWRLHRTDESNWNDFGTWGMRDDGVGFPTDYPVLMTKPLPKGSKLACEANNTNNAQVDNILMFLSKGMEPLTFGNQWRSQHMEKGYEPFRFTGGTTLVAGVLGDVPLTAITFDPEPKGIYHIAGATGIDATGGGGRMKHRLGGTQNVRPGFLVGDDALPNCSTVTWQDFGRFTGDQYPIIQHLSSTAVTAEEYLFWIKQVA